ncbi:MBOAT family O-acyltransferase [Cognatitamlana onchidii]|uniref:MBOAT family O-acyltransferase n=1 Tax=Cognatitamlana onchidii TaxID=2562860 RepID=UPI0010A5F3C2|nr:MBOAT family O-acyltransferase [Algibacter onchidii]
MLFNSVTFLIFLPTVFILYWFVFKKSLTVRNILLLVASYVFYGWWDYRFLGLIIASTLVDFTLGICLSNKKFDAYRKLFLIISLVFNLGLLGFFKYYNFFIDSWVSAWGLVGVEFHPSTLQIILPVGISFYTFQTLSYTIDIYRKKLAPTKDFVSFAAYVAFFPQLVAGPIERASHLLPQFSKIKSFDFEFAKSGVGLIVWGLFKKIVVADNCAYFVNQIFENPIGYSTLELWIGVLFFSFQIYGDFSGYSDIAIGVSRLFGFDLMTNFKFPYFSRNIAEFWRRWHISLSSWFRDYLYIPLGGSRGNKWQQTRNVFIIFIVSGFWHGANWTFVIWGGIHASLFIPLLLINKNRKYVNAHNYKLKDGISVLLTFIIVSFAWVYFRADNITFALEYTFRMFSIDDFSITSLYKTSKTLLFALISVFSILVMLWLEFRAVKKKYNEVHLSGFGLLCISVLILFLGVFKNPAEFIYFQF